MEDEDFKQLLLDYAATANNPQYNGDWDVIDAKFPELEQYDRNLLHDYVATYNNPEYQQDVEVVNAKFPELFPVKKKDESQIAPSVYPSDGEETSAVSPSISEGQPIDAVSPEPLTAKTPDEVPYQEVQFLTGDLGNAINSIPFIGDLIDDGARAIAQGQRQGAVVNDALKVMTKGKTATDDEIANLIAEVQRMEELGPSDEYNTFQEIATKEGGVFGFLKGLASAPQAVPEVFLQSMSSMVNEATAGIAGPVALGGMAFGGPAGALATLPYTMAAAGATMETGLTFAELLKEELEEKKLDFDIEGVRAVLEDEDAMSRIRRKSAIRGGVIGTVDALTGRLAVKTGAKMLRKGTKMKTLAAETGIESAGSMLGEGAATVAVGDTPTAMDVLMEGAAGTVGAGPSFLATVARRGKYTVNGQKVDRAMVQDILNNSTPEELKDIDISIENDNDLKAEVQKEQVRAEIAENLPRNFTEESKSELLDLEYERAQLSGKRDTRSKKKRMDEIDARIDEIFESEREAKIQKARDEGQTVFTAELDVTGRTDELDPTSPVSYRFRSERLDPTDTEVATLEGGEVALPETDISKPIPPPEPPTPGKAFEAPQKTRKEATRDFLIRKFQDKFIDVFRLQDAAATARGKLEQDQDFRMAEELFYGRAADKIDKLEGKLDDITSGMKEAGITMDQFDEYLYARHAKERNAKIFESQKAEADELRSKQNKTSKEKNRLKELEERIRNMDGSGMSDAEADAILQSYEKEFGEAIGPDQKSSIQNLHDMVMEITAENRALAVEAGLISQAEADRQAAEQPNYVPLQGFASDERGSTTDPSYVSGGQGFNVRGKEGKKARGRQSKAATPLAQLITNSATLRIRAERNMALQKLHNLVSENPNADIWKVVKPGESVRTENSVGVKINGEEHFIEFQDPSYVRSLKEMGTENIPQFLQYLRPINNWLRRSFTSLSPQFVLNNFVRDIESGVFNALAESDIPGGQLEGRKEVAGRMIKRIPQTMKALLQEEVAGKDSKLAEQYAQYKALGGKTGWAYAKSLQERKADIEKSLSMSDHPFSGKGIVKFLEGVNDAVENSIRFAAFVESVDAGVSPEKSAQLAKNLTVNFNKSGEWGAMLDTVKIFFNAAMQGGARNFRSLSSPKARKRMAGLVVVAGMLNMANRAMSGEDEDGELFYDKIPDYEKERSIIIMTGPEDYVKIPLFYGLGAIVNLGTAMADVAAGARTPMEGLVFSAMNIANGFSPVQIGASDEKYKEALRLVFPSAGMAGLDLALNQDYFGNKIYTEQFPFGTPKPQSELARRAPTPLINAGKYINQITGGDENNPGAIDFNVDQAWYPIEYYMGGAGRFAMDVGSTAGAVIRGESPEVRDVPLARTFKGDAKETAFFYDMDKYEENRVSLLQLYESYKENPKDRDNPKYKGIRQAFAKYKIAEGKMRVIRQQLKAAKDIENRTERSQRIEELREKQRQAMMEFNKHFKRVRG